MFLTQRDLFPSERLFPLHTVICADDLLVASAASVPHQKPGCYKYGVLGLGAMPYPLKLQSILMRVASTQTPHWNTDMNHLRRANCFA